MAELPADVADGVAWLFAGLEARVRQAEVEGELMHIRDEARRESAGGGDAAPPLSSLYSLSSCSSLSSSLSPPLSSRWVERRDASVEAGQMQGGPISLETALRGLVHAGSEGGDWLDCSSRLEAESEREEGGRVEGGGGGEGARVEATARSPGKVQEARDGVQAKGLEENEQGRTTVDPSGKWLAESAQLEESKPRRGGRKRVGGPLQSAITLSRSHHSLYEGCERRPVEARQGAKQSDGEVSLAPLGGHLKAVYRRAERLQADFLFLQEGALMRRRQTEAHLMAISRLEAQIGTAEAELAILQEEASVLRRAIREARRPASLRKHHSRLIYLSTDASHVDVSYRSNPTLTDGSAEYIPISPRARARSTSSACSAAKPAIRTAQQLQARQGSDSGHPVGWPGSDSPDGSGTPLEQSPTCVCVEETEPVSPPLPHLIGTAARTCMDFAFHTPGTRLRKGVKILRSVAKELDGYGGDAGGLRCDAFLQAFEEGTIKMQMMLGSSFVMAVRNDAGNIKKVRAVLSKLGPAATLREALSFELSRRAHTPGPPPKGAILASSSAAMGITWLLRSLHFCSLLLDGAMRQADRRTSLSEAAMRAYRDALQPFHGWLLQGVFSRSVKSLPRFDDLSGLLCAPALPNNQWEEAMREDLAAFVTSGLRLFEAGHAFLEEMELLDLRKV